MNSRVNRFLKHFRTSVEAYFENPLLGLSIDGSLKKQIMMLFRMNLLRGITLSIVGSLMLVAVPVLVMAQGNSVDAASLQKKTADAQARIQANKDDRDQLLIAVKTNEVPLAKQVLLRNGFTEQDLENATIILRTGGGKSGENDFEISATCCHPKEITIRRSLDYFTK
ncbi:MAG: hypothetical protein ACM3NN_09050 [Nitrospirota bacterium]